ncbi:ArsR/SmtB family transcription factor [Caenibacillus caldisaponilyticus]|uniref:ArsR/SmtB family transcription factor n=1 Tax=Caenibacillus caldisaponilyticus TaxID=1674942 RepID=UPI0009884CF9|nr:metalloregulator ArsR/SmtB family transcription factor [Caenibacillus caldisaponilyticus]
MTLNTEQLAKIAKALSDPIRLKILDLIRAGYSELDVNPPVACCTGGVCVCDIQEQMDMAQSKVSYHLKELKNAGLVTETKVGKWNFYSINRSTFQDYLKEIYRLYIDGDPVATHIEHGERRESPYVQQNRP